MPQDTENILRELGQRLRHRRLARRDRQSDMAARIGVSRPTYSTLENGDPGVAVGQWLTALSVIGNPRVLLDTIPVDLFEMADQAGRRTGRRRKRS